MLAESMIVSPSSIPRLRRTGRSRRPRAWIVTLVLLAAILPSATAGGEPAGRADPPLGDKAENAATSYIEAFKAIEGMLEEPGTPLKSSGPPRLDEKAKALVVRLDPAIRLLHRGTRQSRCEWKLDLQRRGAAATIYHIASTRPLARGAALYAASRWETGDRRQAKEVAEDMLAFARHVGAAGRDGLVSLTASYDIEAMVIDLVCRWMTDAGSAALLEDLCRGPERPEGNLPKVALLLETETILPWAKRLAAEQDLDSQDRQDREKYIAPLVQRHGREDLLKLIAASEEHYKLTGELLDLPPEEFAPRFGQYLRKLDGAGNPFSQVGIVKCPGIPRGYWGEKRLRAQWKMLQAANGIQKRGPEASRDILDPFGDRPFECERSRDGFILRSALAIDDDRVTLEFKSGRSPPTP